MTQRLRDARAEKARHLSYDTTDLLTSVLSYSDGHALNYAEPGTKRPLLVEETVRHLLQGRGISHLSGELQERLAHSFAELTVQEMSVELYAGFDHTGLPDGTVPLVLAPNPTNDCKQEIGVYLEDGTYLGRLDSYFASCHPVGDDFPVSGMVERKGILYHCLSW